MIVKCKACGNEFITKYNAKKYCNEKCRAKNIVRLKSNSKYKCEFCGEIFTSGRKRKYCNDNCRLKANGQRKELSIVSQKIEKPKYSLAEVSKMALEAGLTYGQYVAKYQI